jgi:FtsP/CotA-like multicopper oxidase with cupredoxin domain
MYKRRRDVFLQIESIDGYSPLAPVLCSRGYGRDCMYSPGHESGRIPPDEIFAASVDALVYREYLDPHYLVPKTTKLIAADVNEPPWNRRVPGTVLWARPGERLYIHVRNGDAHDCHSFHLHGLRYGIDSDGAWPFGVSTRDDRRSDEILPGKSWTYVFDATPETIGAWAFHDHAHEVARHVNRGLFGGLIVRDPEVHCADHEIPLFVHQMQGGVECQIDSGVLHHGDTFDFTFPATPGTCHYHCRIHGITMAGIVRIVAGGPATSTVAIRDNYFDPATVDVAPGGKVKWKNEGTNDHIVYSGGGGAASYCLNGRTFVGNTPTVVADAGERLRWFVFNLDFGGTWHNFHPHSTRWRLPTPAGGASDVHSLSPAESFVADTEAPSALRLPCALEDLQCDPPSDACRVRVKGDFLFHCHIEEHMMAGLAGLVRSREWVWITHDLERSLQLELPYDDVSNECPPVDVERCGHRRLRQPATGMGGEGAMAGMAGTPPIDMHQARAQGLWELLPCDSQVLAVHAALLHTGRVLFFAGTGNDPAKEPAHDFRSVVWDCQNGTFHKPFTPIDFFCAGQAFLPDGRLLVAGGTQQYDPFFGLRDSYLFDTLAEDWVHVQDMAHGRWYPSLVALGDGEVLAVGGDDEASHRNRLPETYANATGWTAHTPFAADPPNFPHLFLLVNGRVFYSGGYMGGGGFGPGRINVATSAVAAVSGLRLPGQRGQAASVLLPPAQLQHVLIMGGGDPAIELVDRIDLSAATPKYQPAASLHHARMHLNAVLLPDRTVFVSGGGLHDERDPVKVAEIYDPVANAWTEAATAMVPRLYHSVALLLPDGRVITAGSNPHRGDDELRLELFHPPYLFRGRRPFITDVTGSVGYGETIEIDTPQADEIEWVELIRPMATTHSCDTEQRLVDLEIERRRHPCRVRARIPDEPNLVPPGWYMLFIVDSERVPSAARWIHLPVAPMKPPRPLRRRARSRRARR